MVRCMYCVCVCVCVCVCAGVCVQVLYDLEEEGKEKSDDSRPLLGDNVLMYVREGILGYLWRQ